MRTKQPQPGIAAKYAADCQRCPVPIRPGDRVVFQRGRYIHATCASGGDE